MSTRRVHHFLFLILLLTTILPGASVLGAGNTLHVSPSGNDGNSCSPTLPCREIRRALALVGPGDTILVSDGSYKGFNVDSLNGTAANPIVIRAQGTNAVIQPTTDRSDNRDTIFISFSSYIVVDGLRSFNANRAALRVSESPSVTVRNCVFGNNTQWGIFTDFSDDLLIENNQTYGSIVEHGIYASNSGDRPVIRANRVYNNKGNGIHVNGDISSGGDGIISGALIENNIVYNNGVAGGSGINMDGVQDSTIRNNLLYNNHATGIGIYQIDGGEGPRGNKVYHNTVHQASDGRWALLIWNTSGPITVRNNILYHPSPSRGGITYYDNVDVNNTDSDYNVLDRITPDDAGTVYSLAQWQARGRESHSLSAPPTALFVNAAGGDYHLASGSPAIDRGQTLAAVTRDLEGNTRPLGAASDIGACEAAGGSQPSSLRISDVTVTEGNSGTVNASFTVTLSPSSSQTVTVSYSTAANTATAGSDYVSQSGSLSFAPGQTTKTIAVAVNGDTTGEPDESFWVNLSSPANATLADPQGVGTIGNDDSATLSLSINDVTVVEGNSGTVNATFTVTLSGASSQTVTVSYATANGTATASSSDYVAQSGSLGFTAGQTTKTVAVVVNGDTVVEPNETFLVNLSNPTNATLADSQGQATINNDDTASMPALSINDVTVAEGNSGTVNATFTVTLSAPSSQTVTVNYATANGSASAGSDYVAQSASLSFTAGQTAKTIAVVVNGDTTVEPNETFLVNLSNATSATLADSQGQGTISNDDTPPSGGTTFFAPAQPQASLSVKLYPTEVVAPGVATRVTFGMPFPRGSVTAADLAKVRVLKGGVEIPAYVAQLTPWRHATNAALDGTSVRVARIQISYTFTVSSPNYETITVEWGQTPRTQNVPSLVNPRSAWHTVSSGTFVAADGVSEPNVYAVLPKDHVAKGLLRPGRMDPLEPTIPEARENPATMDATQTWPRFLEQEHASLNNFYSIINQDDPLVTPANQSPYKTDYEPWLYDRASTIYSLYLRSGYLTPLREAVRAADFYRSRLNQAGLFTLNPGNDPKYSYNECLAYTYWLTGDDTFLAPIGWVVSAQDGAPGRWSPNLNFWTERAAAFRLLASTVAYEVQGDASSKSRLLSQTQDLIWHQNGAGGLLPANRVDGGLYHYGSQHADGTPGEFLASGWMGVLVSDAMVRAYASTEDPAIAGFVRRMGTFFKAASKVDANHLYDTADPLAYPDYMMRYDGITDERDGTECEHALETSAAAAWAYYFSGLLGSPDASLRQLSLDLYKTYDEGVNYWIRPAAPQSGLTAFRVGPWRKYGWEHRPSGSLSWIMNAAQPPPPATPSLSVGDASVTEGNAGTANASFTVTLSAASSQTVTVSYASANGTAAAGSDYVAQSGSLSFAAGQTTKIIAVVVNGDTAVEPNETFLVNLSSPTNATLADAQGQGTINNDDTAPLPTLSINDVAVAEGNSGTVNATFTVTLSAASSKTVTVNYATANGTATAGSDYVAQSASLSFTAGQTSKTIAVVVNGDTAVEPSETFLVNLSIPANATLADAQGQGAIHNDDTTAPALQATPTSLSFGSVTVGSSANLTVTVKNVGGGTLTGSGSTAAPFSFVGTASYSLAANQSAVLTVRFSPTVAGAANGTLTLTGAAGGSVALGGTGVAASAGEAVVWTSAGGVSVSGNSLTKTAVTAWGNAGAVSTKSLASGDGYVEFTAQETNTYRMLGLSNGNSNYNWDDIDFAIYPNAGGTLRVYEKGVFRGTFGTYAAGDKLRVAVSGGVVRYSRNGTVLYTSPTAPTYPLLADTSLYSTGATLIGAVVSGNWSAAPPPPPSVGEAVVWTSAGGVSVSGNSLTKTAATVWGNAGAVSTKSLTSGDGYVEFTAQETNTYRMLGLSNGNSNHNWDDIDFAIYPNAGGTLRVYEKGVFRGTFGTYAAGDKLRVAVSGGVVRYSRNGTVLYTSPTAPTYPLLVDTSLYSTGATLIGAVVSGNW